MLPSIIGILNFFCIYLRPVKKFLPVLFLIVKVESTCFDIFFELAYNFIDIFATKMSSPAMKTT